MALMIPNAEIKEIFETTVIRWFDESAKDMEPENSCLMPVWNGDCG